MDLIEFKRKFEQKKVIEEPNLVSSKPLVSVCVQTYQHADFIKECLDSILMQKTNFEIEILLGDDSSTDGTREICKKYAEKFPDKIRLFMHHRENNIAIGGSPTGRFNFMTNLLSAKGKYIALCEGDDYWTDPYKLQKQVDFLVKNEDFVLSFHDTSIVDKFGVLLSKGRLKNNKPIRTSEEIIVGAHIPTLTVTFRNIINEFPDNITKILNADAYLFALLGHHGKAYRHFDIDNACYRKHDLNMWAGRSKFNKYLNQNNTFNAILKISDNRYKKKILRKLTSQNYNLVKFAPTYKEKVKYSFSFIKYALKYKLASKKYL